MTVPLYIVSLPRSTERRELMRSELERLGLSATFVDGITPDELTPEQIARYDRKRALGIYGLDLLPSEKACIMAHERALRTALADGHDCAVILEDDIRLDDTFPAVLACLGGPDAPLRDRWDVIRLDTSRKSSVPRAAARSRTRADLPGGRTLYRLDTHVLGAMGYLVTREGIRKILAFQDRYFMPFDQMMDRFWENGIDPFVVLPPVLSHRDELSSDVGERSLDRHKTASRWTRWRRRVNRWKDSVGKRLHRLRHP
ncbi:glycosyltransferase family 25 protein [Phaeovibrio sulfidiphilus]|uniref:Glycosyltransferase family 25 protein n=1 Tax=Phaeovibrio sulfidiphilus TaxID=1220600 RepID=A0A8J6YWV0_9PROT|nr:glycosyltransferase family 25 protein [Phaeovibrio sulfidiphilus]MBE1237934.1 glycosyltransferase family 25 protein [Phaeovibrio sulfidiphilus]